MEPPQTTVNVEEQLVFIFGQVNEWLKFAEAKNAALVAAATAVIFGITQSVDKILDWDQQYKTWFLLMMLVLLAFGGLCALLSFLPRTQIPFVLKKEEAKQSHNLIFFGDIMKYDPETYLKELCRRMSVTTPPTSMNQQLAEQIVVNARIAAMKYTWFKVALWFVLAGVVTPLGAGLAYVILHEQKKPS